MSAGSLQPLALIEERMGRVANAAETFFDENAARLADACHEMARRFEAGGRLLPFGAGAAASDATHVAVEFVHPVLVGKRALPALALIAERAPKGLAALVQTLGRKEDIVLGLSHDAGGTLERRTLAVARDAGMLTLHLAGGATAESDVAAFTFVVRSDDPTVVQEVHETAYHVLWELVHVFFEPRVS